MPKVSEIVKATGISENRVLSLLRSSDKYKGKINTSLMGTTTVDADLNEVAAFVKSADAARAALEEAEKAEQARAEAERLQAEQEYNAEVANVLITSGYSFEGYRITKYSGYISGDDCVTMPRDNFWGSNKVADNLCGSLVKIRRQALKELKEAAVDLGCNAVIGVDFDYLVMDPQHAAMLNAQQTVYEPYVICVTANGNAVVLEKTE